MDRSSNIKERRRERIRELLDREDSREKQAGYYGEPPPAGRPDKLEAKPVRPEREGWSGGKEPEDLFGAPRREGMPAGGNALEPDPERVWKERRHEWENTGGGGGFVSALLQRLLVSAVLFAAVWGVYQIDKPWTSDIRQFVAGALTEDMDFAAVQAWYEQYFEGPSAFIPIFGSSEEPARKAAAEGGLLPPVSGTVLQPFAATLRGIEIGAAGDSNGAGSVKSVDIGRVLSVAREPLGGLRVTIRHSGSITAEYGHLEGTVLKQNDWVEAGDAVGWLNGEEGPLYFAVKSGETYIDPAEVIAFD